jgi:hypothetical protein
VTDPEPALLLELTKARAHITELEAELDTATAHVEELRGQRDEARGIADSWLEWGVNPWHADQPDQKTPSGRLSATQADERGADDGAGTEGSQAQGGEQGDCGVCDGPCRYGAPNDHADRDIMAMQSFDAAERNEPAPAEPAGLDAAIEAAAYELDWIDRKAVEYAVRAAAPHLVRGERAAALLEAADAMEREIPVKQQLTAAAWLRERAGRELES